MDRDEIEKLIPHRRPFLWIDGVEELEPGVHCLAWKRIDPESPAFAGHFPGNPILPGIFLIEAIAQTACVMLASAAQPIPDAVIAPAAQPISDAAMASAAPPIPDGAIASAAQPVSDAAIASAAQPIPDAEIASAAQSVSDAVIALYAQPVPEACSAACCCEPIQISEARGSRPGTSN